MSCVFVGSHEGTRRFELYLNGGVYEAEVLAIGSSLDGHRRRIPHARVRVVLASGRSVEHQLNTNGNRTIGERLITYCNSTGSDCELDAPPGGRWGIVVGSLGFGTVLAIIAWLLARPRRTEAE